LLGKGRLSAIRIIKHEVVPGCGSFEVRYPDDRPSQYFCWDDIPARRLRPETWDRETALDNAKAAARAAKDRNGKQRLSHFPHEYEQHQQEGRNNAKAPQQSVLHGLPAQMPVWRHEGQPEFRKAHSVCTQLTMRKAPLRCLVAPPSRHYGCGRGLPDMQINQ
jgi:hypothetical protein